ncbi:molecular chaperone [Novosphingobium sp. G106]|uniref:ATP12 family chaperone protein n=1 Tax=Novosphingobium sp. G106 TaxID=2849500 RepID=UPI001C2CF4B0|nr:ATP12 family protein [Novosphingobium sp. G106]MBV1686592.1 molecular chaperone [Novosphingobium sp. G106]
MKRFYKDVSVAEGDGGWRVLLDGRGIKTVAGKPQILPTRRLAEALAEEWADQGEELDPKDFVLRDMADYALDVVPQERAVVIRSLVAFAGTDTLCYRAEPDEPLRERQEEMWEPLLHAAEQRWDVHFERIGGIMHRPQPAATLARMQAVLEATSDHELAALNTLTSLAASLVIALAALTPEAEAEALWNVANLEEDWQVELWGQDYEAQALRERRLATFETAMRFARLARE